MIKVSIIVPVYNVEKYLEKCIDSLTRQTLEDIEIIIVNDGSPDNSKAIIDKYVKRFPQKVIYFEQENNGQGSARNLGIKNSSGEFIGFVDGDDYVDANMYEEMYKLAKDKKNEIVVCDLINENLNESIYLDCTNFTHTFDFSHSVCNKIFERKVFDNIGFLSNMWYEDLNVNAKIFSETLNIGVISKGFYHAVNRDGSTMNNHNSLKNLDIIKCIDDINKYFKINEFDKDKEIISYLIFNHILITSINRVANQKNKNKKQVLKKLIEYSKENLKNYKKMNFYQKIPKKRKLIAYLNFNNMHNISRFLLNLKK